jgi:hypothetical protein
MAKVALASILESVHGRIGNIIFYNVKGNQYARSYTIPYNPRTEKQQKNRIRFADAVKLWQHLSLEEKSAYNLQAADKPLSGYNLFISMTLNEITLETFTPAETIQSAVKVLPAIYQRANTSVSTGLYIHYTCNNQKLKIKSLKLPPGVTLEAA